MRRLLLPALTLLVTSTLTLACYPSSGRVGTSELLLLVQNKAMKPDVAPCAVFDDGALADEHGKAYGGIQAVAAVLRGRGLRLVVIRGGAPASAPASAPAADIGFTPAEVRSVPPRGDKAAFAREVCGGRPAYVFAAAAAADAALLATAAVPVAVRPQGRDLAAARRRGLLIYAHPENAPW
jgi:hypothetical protein